MCTEDKQLLLIDLCSRLPYKPMCSIFRVDDFGVGWRDEILNGFFKDEKDYEFYFGDMFAIDDITKIKLYLRPMSSMTEEEYKEYRNIDNRSYSCPIDYAHIPASDRIDWLNAHHFDFRNLIERGLAISTEEFNPYEK